MKQEKDNLKAMELYAVGLQDIEPRHYIRMPEILDYLTYIHESIDPETGVKTYERKRLTPIEKELYKIIRKAAGDKGCWKTRDNLAFEVNCSAGAVTNAKQVLTLSFEQLNGEPLIYIEERMIPTTIESKIINKKPSHFITVKTIWKYNNAFMDSLKHLDYLDIYKVGVMTDQEAELAIEILRQPSIVHKSMARSPGDNAMGARSPGDNATQGARSPGDINHIPYNHIPYDKSYSPATAGSDDSKLWRETNEMMKKIGIFEAVQKKLLKTWGVRHVADKIQHFKTLDLQKISNPGAYLVSMIEEKIRCLN